MADTCAKCKGLLNFWLRGRTIRVQSDGDITVLVSRMRRTEAYDGEFTQEERNPKITATIVVPITERVTDLQELCDVPVQVELCDGRTFSTEHASQVSDSPYDAKRNLQPIELICDRIQEQAPQSATTGAAVAGAPAL